MPGYQYRGNQPDTETTTPTLRPAPATRPTAPRQSTAAKGPKIVWEETP